MCLETGISSQLWQFLQGDNEWPTDFLGTLFSGNPMFIPIFIYKSCAIFFSWSWQTMQAKRRRRTMDGIAWALSMGTQGASTVTNEPGKFEKLLFLIWENHRKTIGKWWFNRGLTVILVVTGTWLDYVSINIGKWIIIRIDELIFFRGVGQPPTTYDLDIFSL